MRKGTLQLSAVVLVFVCSMIIKPMPSIGYDSIPVSEGGEDFFDLLLVLVILAGLECADRTNLIPFKLPTVIKNIIGMCMLLMVGAIMIKFGWISSDYFESTIVAHTPITLVDVYVLATVGAILLWSGGMAYRVMMGATNAVGNVCWWFFKKVGLGEESTIDELPDMGEICDKCGKPMKLAFYDRPGGPPGNSRICDCDKQDLQESKIDGDREDG